jgi:mitochondrial import inner membrane translocase subunit TIM54
MTRKLTVYLEAPPGDGLRVAQDHFSEYVKPVLASSGLDWDFVVGRREGDVRAVVAERIRRIRRVSEGVADPETPTDDDAIAAVRKKWGISEFEGVKGDIVVGRNTWKEYVRGLHEGWLGPLSLPTDSSGGMPKADVSSEDGESKQPPQPQPFNSTDEYPSSSLPLLVPAELTPSITIPFPHILGFLNTPTRMRRFLTRRYLADQIGRDIAAVCLAHVREFKEDLEGCEQETALVREERDWIKRVWKDDPPPKPSDDDVREAKKEEPPREKIWAKPIVMDSRIAARMRTFELPYDEEDRTRKIIISEEEVEGWIKGSVRHLLRSVFGGSTKKTPMPNIGDVDSLD